MIKTFPAIKMMFKTPKFLIRFVLVAALFCFFGAKQNLFAIKEANPLEILFIGNSYTYYNNLPQMLKELALLSGKEVYIDAHVYGGRSLYEHAIDELSTEKIKERKWDFIILQGTGRRIAYPATFNEFPIGDALEILTNEIRDNCSSTRIIFFMPWADEDGMTWYEDWTIEYEQMQTDIYTNTLQYAKIFKLSIAPIGWVWYAVLSEKNFPLHFLHSNDWNHPSIKGSFLTACVIFSSIFIESSVDNPYHASLDIAEANYFKTIASNLVLENLDDWRISPYTDTACGELTNTNAIYADYNKSAVLFQNYPNPFAGITRIKYRLIENSEVELNLYNSLGIKLTSLLKQQQGAGTYSFTFDGSHLNSGIYYYSLKTDTDYLLRKMLIIR